MNFEVTRLENDERLLSQLESIRTSENIQVLVPFAKAYLGMFYIIDSKLPAADKVRLLANKTLAEAIFQGFVASLKRSSLPTVEDIGSAMAEQKELPEGYVMLAGLDLLASATPEDIASLPGETLATVSGFYFSNKVNHKSHWFDYLFSHHKAMMVTNIGRYWVAMLKNNAVYLPGIDLVLGTAPDELMLEECVLPLLQHWENCKAKTLFRLLLQAFQYSDPQALLRVAEAKLAEEEKLSERAQLYWTATACFISPAKHYARLSAYTGRVKIKVMPLLDLINQAMLNKESKIDFNDRLVADLLRLIAPIFPPQHHVYGSLGGLDINSKNVMLLFYALACSKSENVTHELKTLRKVRVMKIYSGVIDYLLEMQLRKTNEAAFAMPDFDAFLASLFENDLLQGKSNRFDLR